MFTRINQPVYLKSYTDIISTVCDTGAFPLSVELLERPPCAPRLGLFSSRRKSIHVTAVSRPEMPYAINVLYLRRAADGFLILISQRFGLDRALVSPDLVSFSQSQYMTLDAVTLRDLEVSRRVNICSVSLALETAVLELSTRGRGCMVQGVICRRAYLKVIKWL